MTGHPFKKFRQSNVSRSRVGDLTSAYDKGTDLLSDESPIARIRADRPMRASGGRVGKKSGVVVNVITQAPQQQPPMPPPMPPEAAMPPPPPPGPPPGGPPPGAMGPGGPPLGGPMGPPPMRARGGGVKSKGMDVGTKVSHDVAKMEVGKLNRPRVVTFKTGGGVVKSFRAGGAIMSSAKGEMGPKLPGGAGGGKGRLKKTSMTKHGSQV